MAHLTPAAHHHFATHHGIASIGQLIDCGMTRHEIKRLTELGSLEFVVQGAYRSPSVDFDELARCAAISIAHPESVIAGPTAGRLWGFRRLPADRRIHVISPPASHPTSCDWVVPYRTSAIDSDDVFERPDGIRLTTRPRTAFDLARFVSPSDLRSIIEQAMHDGRHSADDMADVAIAWQSPRRRWARTYLEQLGQRVDGGAAESHPEVMLAEALVHAGVRDLRRQHPIALPDYGQARFDLAVPAIKWAIEVDVHPTHRESAGIDSDGRRDRSAASIGWLVSRVAKRAYRDAFAETVSELHSIYLARSSR